MEKPIKFDGILPRPEPGSKDIVDHYKRLEEEGWGANAIDDEFRMNDTKLAWHKDRLNQWAENPENGVISPLHIDMGITTGCNLACHFCYGVVQARHGFQGKQGRMLFMSKDVIKKVFSDAKEMGVRSIALIGEGENTINPALYPSLMHARDIKLDVSLATHGASLRPQHYETLLTSCVWVRFNISAATEDSYKLIHQRPWLNKVIDNAEKMMNLREQKSLVHFSGDATTLGFQMVVTKQNMNDVIPLSKLARDAGVDYLVVKACSDTPERIFDAPTTEYIEKKEIFEEAEKMSTGKTKIIVRWEKLGNLGNKIYPKCFGTKFIIAISGNGNVFPCGHWFDIEKEKFLMGNINQTSLKDVIFGQQAKKAQNNILNLDLRNCETNCRQHQINKQLSILYNSNNTLKEIDELDDSNKPSHINFI